MTAFEFRSYINKIQVKFYLAIHTQKLPLPYDCSIRIIINFIGIVNYIFMILVIETIFLPDIEVTFIYTATCVLTHICRCVDYLKRIIFMW